MGGGDMASQRIRRTSLVARLSGAVLAWTALAGCGTGGALLGARDSWLVSGALPLVDGQSAIGRALAAARDSDAEIVTLPSLDGWPRSIRAGHVYGLFQLSPLVAQMGVLSEKERAEAGFGIGVVLGYRLLVGGTTTLGLEFVNEESWHRNPASDVQGLALRTGVGARMTFRVDERVHPFGVAGAGSYALDFEGLPADYDLSGVGIFFGGGVDFALKRNFSARAELVMHVWDAAEPSGHGGVAETLALGLGAAFSF